MNQVAGAHFLNLINLFMLFNPNGIEMQQIIR